MKKVLAIGFSNVTRMLRDRSNIFFVFIFPIAIILLIGVQFGGGVVPGVGWSRYGAKSGPQLSWGARIHSRAPVDRENFTIALFLENEISVAQLEEWNDGR